MTTVDQDEGHELARRALTHFLNNGTDQAPSTMNVPIGYYTDPDRFEHEVDRIFRHVPLAMALSLELPKPGSYRSLTVMDRPVLLTRDESGLARAFLNVCRHRGSVICEEGSGEAQRFTCPYHGWSYGGDGQLVGIFGASVFGDVDRDNRGLTELPCAERSGLIWVSLDPTNQFDIDDWLGEFAPELETLDLKNWHILDQRQLVGAPGWKVAWDGYLESYHHKFVHPETVGKYTVPNLLLHDAYGPHQRIVFARKELAELVNVPEDKWVDPGQYVRQIHSGFPNLSISGILGDHALVSQLYPGPTVDTTVTVQTVLAAKEPTTPEEQEVSAAFSETVLVAVRDEDYAIGAGIQQAINAGANESFLFGRNEIALQHYHAKVAEYAG
jgi:phenylpropionate dioxygenase-like ring-hydroxylating dioxygenase large terminal subunit